MDIPQPHIQCTPVCSALLAMEDQVMKSVLRVPVSVRKARADESIEGNKNFCSPPDRVWKEGLISEFATCI